MNITTIAQRLSLLVLLVTAPLSAALAAQATPAPPQLAAKSYVLMDAASGNVLVENNSDQRLPPASLTKLMTAYIATLEIRKGKIGEQDMVPVSEHAWRTGGAAFIDARQDAHGVGLLPLRREARRARPALVEPWLQVGLRQRQPRRAAVNDRAKRRPVRFAPGGEAEEVAEAVVAHTTLMSGASSAFMPMTL